MLMKQMRGARRIVQPTPPSAAPISKILKPSFPLSLPDSWQQWRSRDALAQAEENLMDTVRLHPARSDGFKVKSLDILVDVTPNSVKRRILGAKPDLFMHELEVAPSNGSERHTVFVHGYGASKGYFYRNFRDLATTCNVHALDWLGYGRSSRVPVNLPRFDSRKDGVRYAESFFLTAFESWRKQRGIERFTLVAHSLGAYLACAYASQYPSRVEKLVLVSPASVNRTSVSIPPAELFPGKLAKMSDHQLRKTVLRDTVSEVFGKPPHIPKWFNWMWEQHWSPFALVRNAGPLGPKITSGWTSRRFSWLPEKEQRALQVYAYNMFNARGSGEYMLNYFLACGGVGRWPLVERLSRIKCPSLWLYGERDWMPSESGREAVRRLRAFGQRAEFDEVSDAGHHLYIDNHEEFNCKVSSFIDNEL